MKRDISTSNQSFSRFHRSIKDFFCWPKDLVIGLVTLNCEKTYFDLYKFGMFFTRNKELIGLINSYGSIRCALNYRSYEVDWPNSSSFGLSNISGFKDSES